MPKLYFHFDDGAASLDGDGIELANIAASRIEAVATLAEILRDGDVERLCGGGAPWRLWVTDAPSGIGNTLLALELTVSGANGPAWPPRKAYR